MSRWAWVEVSPAAIERNVRVLLGEVRPAALWAVVKANGYGHGDLLAARAAVAGGATGLCVALVDEGHRLRDGGIDLPVLVLSEQPEESLGLAVRDRLDLTVYSSTQIDHLERLGAVDHPVHLKVDTGMRRVGASAADAIALADAIAASPAVHLAGVFTHLAVADEPDHMFTTRQLDLFDEVVTALRSRGHRPPLVHAANSAGAIAHPRARYDMVRAGVAIYGISPGHGVDAMVDRLGLVAAMSVRARVSHVKRVAAGAGISYGLRHIVTTATTVATVPIGYADGVPRRLHAVGGSVLIGGRRRPIIGAVTMDQLMVDCGDDEVAIGDDVVIIGRQGDERVSAEDLADRLDTIGYEIVCGLSSRLERRVVDGLSP